MSKERKRTIMCAQLKMRKIFLGAKAAVSGLDFVDADVIVADDTVTIVGHALITGDRVQLTETATLPAGLATGTDYWIIKVNRDTISFATSLANAIAGTVVTITGAAGGGTHTATLTEVKRGADRYRGHKIQVQSTGVYKIVFDPATPYASNDTVTGMVQVKAADRRAHITNILAGSLIVNMETMAGVAVDDFFDLEISGSETDLRW